LWAIGAVAVQWAQLETLMMAFVHAITEKDSRERTLFDSTAAFKERIKQWEILVEQRMQEPQRTGLLAIITRIKNAQQMRDRIMHCTWAGELTPDQTDTTAKSVFNWTKPRKPFEWDLDFGKIMHVAHTLDQIAFDLLAGVAALAPTDKLFMLGDALQRILHKPNPNP
jgi:hypothetical protein